MSSEHVEQVHWICDQCGHKTTSPPMSALPGWLHLAVRQVSGNIDLCALCATKFVDKLPADLHDHIRQRIGHQQGSA